ncbi:MAG TPA: TetR/AcrR family transcriptional regulator [Dongiaceae bacterium]|nr:TetR/AcrR family transcriptional regulator [Dongiaceae bacterium]
MAPDARKKDARNKLLEAALQVIRTKGYAATRVEDICTAAGLSKGAFFHHFSSKEELAIRAAEYFEALAESLFAVAPFQQETEPAKRFLGYIDFRHEIIAGELPDFTCLLGTMVQETYETSPAIVQACDTQMSAHIATLVPDIAAAKSEHAPDATWDPESLALFTQAVLQGAFILAKAKRNPAVAKECVSHLRRYVESELHLASQKTAEDAANNREKVRRTRSRGKSAAG